jgi:hypothetical protein
MSDQKSKLIIWDEASRIFLNDFYNKSGDTLFSIKEKKEERNSLFASICETDPKKFQAIVILAELGSEETYLQDFWGINIAMDLRKKGYRHPIIFVSFFTPQEVRKIDKKKRQITGAIGHDFVQIRNDVNLKTEIESKLSRMCDLNDHQYLYVRRHHCDLRGTVSSKFHDLKNDILKYEKQYGFNKLVKFINGELNILKSILLGHEKAIKRLEELFIDINASDETKKEKIISLKNRPQEDFLFFLEMETETENQNEEKFWEVLYLDDDGIDDDIYNALINVGIKDEEEKRRIHIARTVDEAKKIIEKDEYNNITVVISDLRLYDNDPKVAEFWGEHAKECPEQGDDFLVWLSEQNRYNKLVALTGLSRSFAADYFRNLNLDVKLYSKNNLTDIDSINTFAAEVAEYGDELYQLICGLPGGEAWQSKFKDYYRELRQSKDWKCKLSQIDHEATVIINKIIFVQESLLCSQLGKKIGTTPLNIYVGSDYNNASIKTVADLIKAQCEAISDKEIKKSQKAYDQAMENFRKKMVTRRVALYLHCVYGMEQNAMCPYLGVRQGSKVLNNALGILLEQVPYFILPEEKSWLIKVAGEEKLKKRSSDTEQYFHCLLMSWFNKYPEDLDQLKMDKEYLDKYFSGDDENKKFPLIYSIMAGLHHIELLLGLKKVNSDGLKKMMERIIQLVKTDPYCKHDADEIIKKYNTFFYPN